MTGKKTFQKPTARCAVFLSPAVCVFQVSDGLCSRKYIEAVCKKVVLRILELDRMMKKLSSGNLC